MALAVLDGGEVDPDTGRAGLRGRPGGRRARPALLPPRPRRAAPSRAARRAARPFRSPGLRAPWYPALGNHDLLVQGETPPTAQLDAFATGDRMVTGLDPDVRADPDTDAAAAVRALLAAGAPGRSRTVAPDPDRRFLRDGELIADLTGRRAAPPALRARRRPRDARLRRRPRRRTPARSCSTPSTAPAARAACCAPGSSPGCARSSPAPATARVLVFSHNPLDNTEGGEAALAALAATPAAVVAVIAGNGHRNRIRPHPAGFWQIATSSLADFPMQVRALRLRRGPDGRRLRARDLDGRPRRRGPRRAPRASWPSSTPRAAARRASPAARRTATRGSTWRGSELTTYGWSTRPTSRSRRAAPLCPAAVRADRALAETRLVS